MADADRDPPRGYMVWSDYTDDRDPGSWGAGMDVEENEHETRGGAVDACYAHRDSIVEPYRERLSTLVRIIEEAPVGSLGEPHHWRAAQTAKVMRRLQDAIDDTELATLLEKGR